MTWQERARCAEVDAELFFPEQGRSSRPALRICAQCGVQPECLDFAFRFMAMEAQGVWGGTTAAGRERLRRAARRARRDTDVTPAASLPPGALSERDGVHPL